MNMTTNITTAYSPSHILIFPIIGYFSISIVGMIASSTTVAVIARTKEFHTSCFMLIASSCIGSFTYAASSVSTGIDRISVYSGVFKLERTALQCLLPLGFLSLWGMAFHAQMACIVAIDCVIAITMPTRYRLFGNRYWLGFLCFSLTTVTAHVAAGFITAPLNEVVVCNGPPDALTEAFNETFIGTQIFYSASIVALYATMLACFRFRHKFAGEAHSYQDPFMKQQLAVMPTIKLIMRLYLVTSVLADIIAQTVLQLPLSPLSFVVITAAINLKISSSLVESVSLFVRNKKFRDCCLSLIGCKSNAVAAAPVRNNGGGRNAKGMIGRDQNPT